MSGFKNNISDGWLFKQELRMFRNYMKNWTQDVRDSDFFCIFYVEAVLSVRGFAVFYLSAEFYGYCKVASLYFPRVAVL